MDYVNESDQDDSPKKKVKLDHSSNKNGYMVFYCSKDERDIN
jgi:hypothetical protein